MTLPFSCRSAIGLCPEPDVYLSYPRKVHFNPLTLNDDYSGRTALLTSKRCILYIYSTNTGTEYFKHVIQGVPGGMCQTSGGCSLC